MKLHADPLTHLNTVTAYGPGFIEINKVRHSGHLIVSPDAPVQPWAVTGFDTLQASDFAALLERAPEIVLLGTGLRQRFTAPRVVAPLTGAGIGVEAMATAAACRTYNILMAEGRRVLGAFLQA